MIHKKGESCHVCVNGDIHVYFLEVLHMCMSLQNLPCVKIMTHQEVALRLKRQSELNECYEHLNLYTMFPEFIFVITILFVLFLSENGNLYIVMDYCEAGNYNASGCCNYITKY